MNTDKVPCAGKCEMISGTLAQLVELRTFNP